MKRFILKKNNKSFSVEELAQRGITKDTMIRYKDQSKWVRASEIHELSELLTNTSSYNEIRKQYKKRYLISGIKVVYICLSFALIITFPPLTLDKHSSIVNHIFADWKIICYTIITLISITICLYDFLHHKYYRVIKKTEKNPLKTKEYYQIQTFVSFKKSVSKLNERRIRWRVYKDYESIDEAKAGFDKLTADKLILDKTITGEKIQLKTPSVFEFLKEKNRFFYFNPIKKMNVVTISGIMVISCFSIYFLWSKKIWEILPLIPLTLITLFVMIKIYIICSTTYVRVIKRRIKQGSYSKISYHLQSCTTRQKNNINDWKDFNIVKLHKQRINSYKMYYYYIEGNKEELMTVFTKKTRDMTPRVKEESINS